MAAAATQIAAMDVMHNHWSIPVLKRRLNDAILDGERSRMLAEDAQGHQRIMVQASREKRQRMEPLLNLVNGAGQGVTHLSDVLEEDLGGSTDDNIIGAAVYAEDVLSTVGDKLRGARAILDDELGRE